MRALLFLIIISTLALSTGNSFAQTVGPSQQSVLGIYAQIKVQDSSGNLVAYIETSHVTIYDPEKLNSLINANMDMFNRNTVNVGGQNIEVLQVNDSVTHQSPTIVSLNLISVDTSHGKETLVAANHDGYPVVKGDKVTTYWTILRTVPTS
jgi:hypothetical protein